MTRIDAHLHVFAKASREFPREVNDRMPEDREEPVEKLMAAMVENDIDQAMLVQTGGNSIEHHSYLRHCFKEHPNRFLGIGLIPPDAESVEDHMDELAEDGSIIGFRLGSRGAPRDPFDAVDITKYETYPIWKHATKKDFVMWLYPRAIDAHAVIHLVDAFPQVRVVYNHLMVCPGKGKFTWDDLGRPKIETTFPTMTHWSTVVALHGYENVNVLLSGQYAFSKEAYPYKDLQGWHGMLYGKFESSRCMWATDFPWIMEEPGYGPLTKIIDEMLPNLREEEREDIMGGTAKRVLQFPEMEE